MLKTVRKPNIFYAISNNAIIDQTELTKEVYDYYWTSYSRGTDGTGKWRENGDPNFNNAYLNGYNQKRAKSIFDPCPYRFRNTANGTHNKFNNTNCSWFVNSIIGGIKYDMLQKSTWLVANGYRDRPTSYLINLGNMVIYTNGSIYNEYNAYFLGFFYNAKLNLNLGLHIPNGTSVRCIEEC